MTTPDASPPAKPARRIGRPRLGFQRVVDRAPTHEVERIGAEEPSELPIGAIWNEVKALYRAGLHPAIALHVRHQGRVVMDRTLGHVHNEPGHDPGPVASPDTLFSLFSASKIVTAALVHAMIEDGKLGLDDRVVDHLPGFGRRGKAGVRIRHLLNHTAGIPDMPPMDDVDAVIARGQLDLEVLYELDPKTPPGVDVAYHPLTSWFLLQAIVEQAAGTDLRSALDARLLRPMGLAGLTYGVRDEARLDDVARHVVTGPPVPAFMSRIFERSIGVGLDKAIAFTNERAFLTGVIPSANIVATPAEVGAFMQMLLDRGRWNGEQILAPATVDRMVGDVTPLQLDSTFGFPMRYGLGVMMGGNRFSLFGLGTRGAFGHLGLSTVVVYADPSRDLAVAFLNTGKPMMAPGMLQWYAVLQHLAARVPRSSKGPR